MQLYKEKMPQIAIEIEKTSKKFGLLPFLCNFCQIFDTLASLESYKQSTRKELVVQEASSKL